VGSIASQGFGIAIGQQSSINWGSVGLAAIGGGVARGAQALPGLDDAIHSPVLGDFAQRIADNAVTRGIDVATGLQNSFSWQQVAEAGIGSAVSGSLARDFTGDPFNTDNNPANPTGDPSGYGPASFGQQLATGLAGGIANAAIR